MLEALPEVTRTSGHWVGLAASRAGAGLEGAGWAPAVTGRWASLGPGARDGSVQTAPAIQAPSASQVILRTRTVTVEHFVILRSLYKYKAIGIKTSGKNWGLADASHQRL